MGNMGEVVRVGDTVLREAGDWTPAVHRLLSQLGEAGVAGVPKPLGRTEDGREILTFVSGTVPAYPLPEWVWAESALQSAARLLRRVHDASAGLDRSGPWRSPSIEPTEVICHNDFAPHNLVFDGGRVTGAIDWDFAAPGPRLWDVAYLAHRVVPITTASWGDGFSVDERRARLDRLLTAYGTHADPLEVLGVLRTRLLALASFTADAARRLAKPQLLADAELYRRDAAELPNIVVPPPG